MDELLEAAAAELQRSRGIPPPVAQGGDVAAAAAVAQGGHGAEDSEGADTTAVTAPGESEEGNGGGMEENVAAGGEEDGTAARRGATEAGGAERPGGAGAPAAEGLSAERCREILSELSEFRQVFVCVRAGDDTWSSLSTRSSFRVGHRDWVVLGLCVCVLLLCCQGKMCVEKIANFTDTKRVLRDETQTVFSDEEA